MWFNLSKQLELIEHLVIRTMAKFTNLSLKKLQCKYGSTISQVIFQTFMCWRIQMYL